MEKGRCPACGKMVIEDKVTVLLGGIYKKVGLKNWTCCIYCYDKWIKKYLIREKPC